MMRRLRRRWADRRATLAGVRGVCRDDLAELAEVNAPGWSLEHLLADNPRWRERGMREMAP